VRIADVIDGRYDDVVPVVPVVPVVHASPVAAAEGAAR